MMRDVQINRLSVNEQLTELAKLSHGEMLHPSLAEAGSCGGGRFNWRCVR